MIELIKSVLDLIVLIVGEVFKARKAARLKNEKFELDQKAMLDLFDSALQKMRAQGQQDSTDSKTSDDVVDKELLK